MPHRATPVVIVLAAGMGSRFAGAGHKLMQELGSVQVLGMSLRHALASGLPVLCVAGPEAAPLARSLLARDDVLEVGPVERALGMGHSIAQGVAQRANARGWLVLPGDMPLVQASSIRAVAQALDEHPVAHAQHRGRRGHPVGFSAELCSELLGLTGDEGARRIVARYPAHGVEVNDPGVLTDVDTQADLQKLREALQASGSGGTAAVAVQSSS